MVLSADEPPDSEPAHVARTVLVVAGGDAPSATDLERLPLADIVIAADSGADHAARCGLEVDVIIGDLDSVSPERLAAARADGVLIEPVRPDKDESDLELAMQRALSFRPERIVVTAIGGGRVDHLFANVLLICDARFADVDVDCYSNAHQFFVVRSVRTIEVPVGQTITLLPIHGSAHGVSTTGLQYPLRCEPLGAGSPRGLSNVAVARQVTIEVTDGVVLMIVTNEGRP